jgi:hypothetical protein
MEIKGHIETLNRHMEDSKVTLIDISHKITVNQIERVEKIIESLTIAISVLQKVEDGLMVEVVTTQKIRSWTDNKISAISFNGDVYELKKREE